MRESANLYERLQVKDPKLLAWLNEAQSQGEKVVYISLGSMCTWGKWSVEALFYGLKLIQNIRVVWSLKQDV